MNRTQFLVIVSFIIPILVGWYFVGSAIDSNIKMNEKLEYFCVLNNYTGKVDLSFVEGRDNFVGCYSDDGVDWLKYKSVLDCSKIVGCVLNYSFNDTININRNYSRLWITQSSYIIDGNVQLSNTSANYPFMLNVYNMLVDKCRSEGFLYVFDFYKVNGVDQYNISCANWNFTKSYTVVLVEP